MQRERSGVETMEAGSEELLDCPRAGVVGLQGRLQSKRDTSTGVLLGRSVPGREDRWESLYMLALRVLFTTTMIVEKSCLTRAVCEAVCTVPCLPPGRPKPPWMAGSSAFGLLLRFTDQ